MNKNKILHKLKVTATEAFPDAEERISDADMAILHNDKAQKHTTMAQQAWSEAQQAKDHTTCVACLNRAASHLQAARVYRYKANKATR